MRRKRNFLMHALWFGALSGFFITLNAVTYNAWDGWWFIFPIIGWGLLLSLHFIFTIGKDMSEKMAMKWEAWERGDSIHKVTAENDVVFIEERNGDRLELARYETVPYHDEDEFV